MILPTGYELKKVLSDASNVGLQELKETVEFEIAKRRDESRERYEKKLTIILTHLREEGFKIYADGKPLFIDDIEIL